MTANRRALIERLSELDRQLLDLDYGDPKEQGILQEIATIKREIG